MDKLIVIEGASDGIGKSTQFELLKERLSKSNRVISHHFPSHNEPQGLLVDEYLKGKFGDVKDLSPYFVNSLYAVDRGATWYLELKKEYGNGVILLDRYNTSSVIYQSALISDMDEKKKFIDYIIDFEYEKIGIPKPDKVIFLTAPYDIIKEMRMKRKLLEGEAVAGDIHENDDEFLLKVYNNAIFVANYLGWDIVDCACDNKMKSIDEIHNEIYNLIEE